MKKQTLILVPTPKSTKAPVVELNSNVLVVNVDDEGVYNYAISTGDGSVVQKGVFEGVLEIQLNVFDSSNVFQLDLFNLEYHFAYNFIAS